jgi:hypothetical protein
LCREQGRFLFEALPDRFPGRRLTPVEAQVWGLYFNELNAQRHG